MDLGLEGEGTVGNLSEKLTPHRSGKRSRQIIYYLELPCFVRNVFVRKYIDLPGNESI